MVARAEGRSWGDMEGNTRPPGGDGTALGLNYAAGYVKADM